MARVGVARASVPGILHQFSSGVRHSAVYFTASGFLEHGRVD